MFKKASRLKLRFGYKGSCSVEDLWDLTVEELDEIYKGLKMYENNSESESLLVNRKKKSPKMIANELGVEIVTEIVNVKIKEAEDNENRIEKKKKKQILLEIISEKENQKLKDMPIEDLAKLVDEL